MGQKSNPISLRLRINRHHDSLWFSDTYYRKHLCSDLRLRQSISNLLERKGTPSSRPGTLAGANLRKRKSLHLLFSRVFLQFLPQKVRVFPLVARVRLRRARVRSPRIGKAQRPSRTSSKKFQGRSVSGTREWAIIRPSGVKSSAPKKSKQGLEKKEL